MDIRIAGENALVVYLGEGIDPALLSQVQQLEAAVEASLGEVIVDLIPSYSSLVIIFNPRLTDHRRLRRALRDLPSAPNNALAAGKTVELPVYYSEESGPDIGRVANGAGLTLDEVANLHSGRDYLVYSIGFAPGFAYLGRVDERLQTPRLSKPRPAVPKGAVAIADSQTAVYPTASPGGWNLIGLCPVELFSPQQSPSMPVSVGDTVRFRPISRAQFLALGGEL